LCEGYKKREQQMMKHENVFISYVRENEEQVLKVCRHLKRHDISYWIDKEQLLPGDFWASSIYNAIKNGALFLVFFSKESETKDKSYMREEIDIAIKASKLLPLNRKWIIPVKLSECEIPDYELSNGMSLNHIQYVELFKDWNAGISFIIKSILANHSFSSTIFRDKDFNQDLIGAYLHDMNNLIMAIDGFNQLQSLEHKTEYTVNINLLLNRIRELLHDFNAISKQRKL
jgi:hypothetical protein